MKEFLYDIPKTTETVAMINFSFYPGTLQLNCYLSICDGSYIASIFVFLSIMEKRDDALEALLRLERKF